MIMSTDTSTVAETDAAREPAPVGVLASLRRLMETSLAILHNRLELAAVEFQEEKSRLAAIFLWAAILVFFGIMSVVALMVMTIFLFWENRLAVAIGFSILFVVGAVAAYLALHGKLKKPPIPFAETIDQLRKDRQWLSGKD